MFSRGSDKLGPFTDDVVSEVFVDSVSADAVARRPVVDDLPGLDAPPSAPPVLDLADLGRECGVPADGCGGRGDVATVGDGLGAD